MKLNSAVITGATGVVGTALIDRLIKEEIKVFAVCRPESKRFGNIPKSELVECVECDIGNLKMLPNRIACKVDAFFHFAWAGTTGESRMDMYLQNQNVRYSLDSVHAARAMGCEVYIGAGSQAEYGRLNDIMRPDSPVNPVSGYGMAKLCAGQMTRALCKEFGIRHIWPRILSVYGLHDSESTLIRYVIDSLLNKKTPALTSGTQIWDYLYADDAAEAFYGMALHGRDGKVYVLGSGEGRSLKSYIEELRDVVDENGDLGFGQIPYYKDQAMRLEADIMDLKLDLGWKPRTSFKCGIKKIIDSYESFL